MYFLHVTNVLRHNLKRQCQTTKTRQEPIPGITMYKITPLTSKKMSYMCNCFIKMANKNMQYWNGYPLKWSLSTTSHQTSSFMFLHARRISPLLSQLRLGSLIKSVSLVPRTEKVKSCPKHVYKLNFIPFNFPLLLWFHTCHWKIHLTFNATHCDHSKIIYLNNHHH